jgi:ABC-type phosphate transport system substrate-binding protein
MAMKSPGRVLASLLLAAAALLGSARAQGEGFRVIVNPQNPVTALSEQELSRLFLKKSVTWPGGGSVAPVDQERTSAVRRAFSQKVHNKDADAVVAHWQTMVFSGRDTPPPVKATDASVVEFVRASPGAVGYVSEAADVAGVKVVAVR